MEKTLGEIQTNMIPEKIFIKIEMDLKGKPDDFQLIGKGSNYDVYKFTVNSNLFVLRLQKRAIYDFSPNESKLLQQLNGVYAPRLLIYDSGELVGSPFMVQEYINGVHIKNLEISHIETVKNTIEQIHFNTKQKPRFEKIKCYYDEIYKEKFGSRFNQIHETDIIKKSTINKLSDSLHSSLDNISDLPVDHECLIHGDLNHANLIWQENCVFFIDWELSRYSIPAIEFGGMIYCHGKSKLLFDNILSLFAEDNRMLIIAAFYLKLLDSICWRINYLSQTQFTKQEYEKQMFDFNRDLEKGTYPV